MTSAGRTRVGEARRFLEDTVLPHKDGECLIWPYNKPNGYAQIKIGGVQMLVQRVVCERVHGAAPSPIHQAAHSCGNGHIGCVSPLHLTWKTPSANQSDRVAHGTSNRSIRNNKAKLSERDAIGIYCLKGRMSLRAVAGAFGVSQKTVEDIQGQRKWQWLTGALP